MARNGPTHNLAPGSEPSDYFSLMVKPEFRTLLEKESNRYVEFRTRTNPNKQWKEVTGQELKCFVGNTIIMGINILPSIKSYWSEDECLSNNFT